MWVGLLRQHTRTLFETMVESTSQDRDIMCLVVFEAVIVQWEMIENGRSIDVNFTVFNCNTSRLNCCTGFTKMGDTLAE
jgi:hypothetical protein